MYSLHPMQGFLLIFGLCLGAMSIGYFIAAWVVGRRSLQFRGMGLPALARENWGKMLTRLSDAIFYFAAASLMIFLAELPAV